MPSRTEDVTLGHFCATLRGDPKAGYLKQCPLEDLGCRWSLRAHAPFLTSWVQETAFLWVGGADATTGLHSDDEDNVLLVTHGPSTCCSTPFIKEAPGPESALRQRHRVLRDRRVSVRGGEGAAVSAVRGCAPPLSFVLRAGDALFIPRDWFHAVRSLDVSVSVNVFYSTLADLATRGAHRALTDFAHNRLGLWRANCAPPAVRCDGRRAARFGVFFAP